MCSSDLFPSHDIAPLFSIFFIYIFLFFYILYKLFTQRVFEYKKSEPFYWTPNHFYLCYKMVVKEGFEPSKSYDGRFTVCSHWPLGNFTTYFTGAAYPIRTDDLLITSQLLWPTELRRRFSFSSLGFPRDKKKYTIFPWFCQYLFC